MYSRENVDVDLIDFMPEQPWPMSECQDAFFYHSMKFPDGSAVDGHWDISGRFEAYIGHYPLVGKTVLDVGTATGFLAFSAERMATRVTALDVRSSQEFRRIPFRNSFYHRERKRWILDYDAEHLHPLRKGFWYSWHKFNSNVEMIYAPLDKLYAWDRKFDVVLAGAIVEHIADPVSAIGVLAGLANEAVIIAFTDVIDTDEPVMHPTHDPSDPILDFEWWKLSRGLYRQIFENLGYTIEIVKSNAIHVVADRTEVTRSTIVARRRLLPIALVSTPKQHNSARVSKFMAPAPSLGIAIETDDAMASYAVSFVPFIPRSVDGVGEPRIVVDLEVEKGVIGVGCTSADYTSWLSPVQLAHAGPRRKIYVQFGENLAAPHLVFCNFSPEGPSLARIHHIDFRRVASSEREGHD